MAPCSTPTWVRSSTESPWLFSMEADGSSQAEVEHLEHFALVEALISHPLPGGSLLVLPANAVAFQSTPSPICWPRSRGDSSDILPVKAAPPSPGRAQSAPTLQPSAAFLVCSAFKGDNPGSGRS